MTDRLICSLCGRDLFDGNSEELYSGICDLCYHDNYEPGYLSPDNPLDLDDDYPIE
jgi:hypothetical protein